ncbi:MAG: peptidylprolyl isomerase [Desulfuromonadaceae bacterium]|nr:peptidylprolyl isomerase [Desulfuromonadaceae bacterium]MDD5104595.1 peptidylprolyl isomerase [Desulfuromonadaceae bacterium]
MTLRIFAAAIPVLTLFMTAGCAGNDAAITKEQPSTTFKDEKTPQSLTAPQEKQHVANAIAAIVNDEIITLNDVNREAKQAIADEEKKGSVIAASREQLNQAALDRLIEKKLAAQKIRELHIVVSEDELRQAIEDVRRQNHMPTQEALVAALAVQGLSLEQYRSQLKEQIEKLKLVSMEVRAKVLVGESEIRAYYTENRAKYSEEESFRARHIFFKTGEKVTPEEIIRAKTTALAVLADAKAGNDFAELAKKFSEDPAARKDGGDLGSFKKGDMQPELEKSIQTLKPGEVSDLVSTPVGFHIIKLEARIAGAAKPFDSVKSEIEEILYRKKSEERFSQWAKDLRSKANIEIKDIEGLQ